MANKVDSLKKRIAATADNVAKKTSKARKRITGVPPHKHCRICHGPIDLKADPAVCNADDCQVGWQGEEKNRKRLKFWMTAFIALFAISFIGPLLSQLLFSGGSS